MKFSRWEKMLIPNLKLRVPNMKIKVGTSHVRVNGIIYKNGIVISTRALCCSLNLLSLLPFLCPSMRSWEEEFFFRQHRTRHEQVQQQQLLLSGAVAFLSVHTIERKQ
mmetsp:Transcript_13435/g.20439  ORF Transcript_13435/g.20439 Transcript_13435/m.20439 type:complete len:108 (+) Transcript_13435:574-897(+)